MPLLGLAAVLLLALAGVAGALVASGDPPPRPRADADPDAVAHAHAEPDADGDRAPDADRDAHPGADRDAGGRQSRGAGRRDAPCGATGGSIEAGRYADAYDRFAPELASRATRRTRWIAAMRRDGLYSAVVDVAPRLTSATRGDRARRAPADQRGPQRLHDWSGTYDLRKVAGTWRISTAGLKSRSC